MSTMNWTFCGIHDTIKTVTIENVKGLEIMKQKKKFEKLIAVLKKHSDFITAKELSDELQSSEKTIYRLVKEINQAYAPDELIIKKKGSGFKLKKELVSDHLLDVPAEDFTPGNRQMRILEKLLLISPKRVLIYDLTQEFYVSESVIMKDRIEIQKQIDAFNLKISTQSGAVFIKGSEFDLRRAIADLIPAFSTIDMDNLAMSTQSETFDVNLARFILSKIKQVENYLHAEHPYPYNVNIFSHLYIMIERLNKGEQKANQSQISFENGSHFDQQLLQISRRIMTDISEYLGRKIADIEVSYLYQYLYSSRFQLDAAQQKIQFSQRVMLVTQFYLEKMDMTKGKHIDKNSPMFIDLANHISPLLRRLDNRIRIKNKMLEEIQKNYSIIYQQTVAVSQEMTKSFGFSHISSDEIGFLTLYFVRFREMSQQPIQTVIMCSSWIGISELLRMKIETEFKDLDIVDVVSAQNARQVLASHPEIKLIITSVDIPVDLDVKHILVSALMTDEDKEKIAKAIQEIHYGD